MGPTCGAWLAKLTWNVEIKMPLFAFVLSLREGAVCDQGLAGDLAGLFCKIEFEPT